MTRKELNSKYGLNINAQHWSRACQHANKHGCGEPIPKPKQPKCKHVLILPKK